MNVLHILGMVQGCILHMPFCAETLSTNFTDQLHRSTCPPLLKSEFRNRVLGLVLGLVWY